ncbi:MAG: type II toxin-antitoxin system RelE/ParE family toxin [Candidatus Sericytochromatia bacterium]|nr:type II toxin-antitoxin system RelE/ParE family toxin [Candidatus Sericytochromatia bacterium]
MNTNFNKKFFKDLSNVPSKERERIEEFVFNELTCYNSIQEVGKVEKLKGYDNYYKIRFGNYRVGLKYENNFVTLERVLHRREIYKLFP